MLLCKHRTRARVSPKPCLCAWPPHACWARKSGTRSLRPPPRASSSGMLSETRVCFPLTDGSDVVTERCQKMALWILDASVLLWKCRPHPEVHCGQDPCDGHMDRTRTPCMQCRHSSRRCQWSLKGGLLGSHFTGAEAT